jgi:hypothetical protein
MNHPSAEIIEALLKRGADVEAENEFGSVLHHIAERGGREAVSIVLKHGASPFAIGKGGVYSRKMPYESTEDKKVRRMLIERMEFLFSHLSFRDQEELIAKSKSKLESFRTAF